MFAITAAPEKQNVSDTIALSSRLSSATLLEDRRGAILGLRSFAKEYPATVAADSLRPLIASLTKDGEDVDTVKITLEVLNFLFNHNEKSAEASEEVILFVADGFTTQQENITLLLDFLDNNDFHLRLTSLQLLSAILASRTERTEECIFVAPLGVERLVAVLDDRRDAVRNEGLALLTYLTPNSTEIQKLVAYQNAFERIFNIIQDEGSLRHGGRVVEDCLILLANLLRLNISNQLYFRETGCVSKLGKLLNDALTEEEEEETNPNHWAQTQQNRNIYALLAVLRLFLVTGGVGTQANQAAFWQNGNGILNQVLQLAFSRSTEAQIKAEALITCADLIRGNATIQEGFAQLQVTSVLDELPVESNGVSHSHHLPNVYVIDGLLDLTLSISLLSAFDSRLAACECIKAYFFHHPAIRKHFLHRAIDGHNSGADETANVLTTLLQPLDSHVSNDPYRYWFASTLLFHLIFDDPDAKNLAMSVTEGDASNGEEVVTCIQTITENLITGIQKQVDERVLIAYLMLLCGWLFEDPDAVNDFLGEGSNIQSLIQAVLSTKGEGVIIQGICALLLGIVYEFSTKDSPIPRATIHTTLGARLGRDQYVDRITKLRGHSFIRDFEVLPQKLSSSSMGGLPEVFFDKSFVDFAKDNFSRLIRAIDRDPGFEVPVVANGIQKGISRDLVDSLRLQLEEKGKRLAKAEEELVSFERKLGQEQADHRRSKETSTIELARIKNVNDALQRNHEEEIKKLREEHHRANEELQRQLEHVQKTAEANAERIRKRTDAEISNLQSKLEKLEASLTKANKDHVQDLQTAHEEYMANRTELEESLKRAEEKFKESDERANAAIARAKKAEEAAADKEARRGSVQTELDDLLMVFQDLEDKTTRYKDRLKEIGQSVSDDEDEEDEEDEGGEEK